MTTPIALVTGAAGGIGAAVVARMRLTHHVISHDLDQRGTSSPHPIDVSADLTTPAGRSKVVRELGGHRLDAVIMCHGRGGTGALPELQRPTIASVMDVNFVSVVRTLEDLRPHLTTKAAVVLVASQAGMTGEAEHAVYCASKFALLGWVRTQQPTPDGPRLRIMAPGCVDTDMLRGAMTRWAEASGADAADVASNRVAHIPAQRFADPSEIAAGIAALASLATPNLVVFNQSGGETFPS